MAAAPTINDYFLKVGNPGSATTLSAPGYTVGNPTINVGSTGAFPTSTAVIFSVDTVSTTTGTQVENTGSYCVFVGIVTSATSIGSVTLLYGTPQNYSAAATTRVFITVSSQHTNRLITGILQQHNQDGTHGAVTATSVTATTGTFTNLSITGTSTAAGWSPTGSTATYAANNGNKEFVINTSTDLSGTLSPGMKYQVTRGTTAPTQSMSFTAASSQYATKASPTGITFTSAFTCEAWVYLNSYGGSAGMNIVNRFDNAVTTGGWAFSITTGGQVNAVYGTTTSFTNFISYQSLPLKRWVHIAAVVSSTASKTGAVYINGALVPSFSSVSAATSLTQASLDLRMGAFAATPANSYFDGYISECRVWSTAQTQANIQANAAISLTGSESGLVALFQGNGNANDKTSNANNLTLTNGAIATQLANPYNNIEYGIVTKVTSTQLTVFTGTDYTIPNMTLNSPQYSLQRTPFGFPADKAKWKVDAIQREDRTFGVGAGDTYYNSFPGMNLAVPIGAWTLTLRGGMEFTGSTSAPIIGKVAVTTEAVAVSAPVSNRALFVPETSTRFGTSGGAAGTGLDVSYNLVAPLTTTASTTYIPVFNTETAGGSYGQRHLGNTINSQSVLTAECAYV